MVLTVSRAQNLGVVCKLRLWGDNDKVQQCCQYLRVAKRCVLRFICGLVDGRHLFWKCLCCDCFPVPNSVWKGSKVCLGVDPLCVARCQVVYKLGRRIVRSAREEVAKGPATGLPRAPCFFRSDLLRVLFMGPVLLFNCYPGSLGRE